LPHAVWQVDSDNLSFINNVLRRPVPNSLMSSDTPSQNPFTSDPIPRKGETRQERTQRKREEARAKAVRDAIEEQIAQDKAASERYKKANKVLLLGQSESGESANAPSNASFLSPNIRSQESPQWSKVWPFPVRLDSSD